MNVLVYDNEEQIGIAAGNYMCGQVLAKPDSVLGLATGSTPLKPYGHMIKLYEQGAVDFSKVTTFNLDEYYPISRDNAQSYYYFMNEHFYSKVNLKPENIHIPNGQTDDVEAECSEYDALIEQSGGIDLQILGIGQNGHIGFNEPDSSLNSATHLTELSKSTIEANARFFDNEADVPKYALTMGMSTILKARKIVLLASGKSKHKALSELFDNSINTSVPATMLKIHPDVVVICDKEAYDGIDK